MTATLFALALASAAVFTPDHGGSHSDLENWLGQDLDRAKVEILNDYQKTGFEPGAESYLYLEYLICSFRTYLQVTADEAEAISHRVSLAYIGKSGVFEFPDGSRYEWDNSVGFLSVTNSSDGSKIMMAPCPWVRDDCDSQRCYDLLPRKDGGTAG